VTQRSQSLVTSIQRGGVYHYGNRQPRLSAAPPCNAGCCSHHASPSLERCTLPKLAARCHLARSSSLPMMSHMGFRKPPLGGLSFDALGSTSNSDKIWSQRVRHIARTAAVTTNLLTFTPALTASCKATSALSFCHTWSLHTHVTMLRGSGRSFAGPPIQWLLRGAPPLPKVLCIRLEEA